MIRIVTLLSILLFTSCVQNVGGKYEWFIEANQKVFDFSTPGDFTYTGTEIVVANNEARLQVNYTEIDTFDDNDYTGVWTPTNINGGGFSFSETGEQMTYDCQAGIEAQVLTTPIVLTDHTTYVETTPSTFDNGLTPLTIVSRYVDDDNFYIGITDNSNHGIYEMIGGFMFPIATVPSTITQTTGTTYAQKFKADGANLYYKIWELGTTEPGWQVTTTDASFASGSFALPCYTGDGEWDNARVYEVAADRDYDVATGYPVVFPEYTISENISRYESLAITATLNGGDTIKFDISDDGGTTFYSYSGGSWNTNTNYAGANTLAEINSNLKTFPTDTSAITIRAWLYSDDGTTTPVFTKLTLTYSTQM